MAATDADAPYETYDHLSTLLWPPSESVDSPSVAPPTYADTITITIDILQGMAAVAVASAIFQQPPVLDVGCVGVGLWTVGSVDGSVVRRGRRLDGYILVGV